MAIIKLTRRNIESLPIPDDRRKSGVRYYDQDLKGFGVTVFPSGRKSYFIEYGKSNRRRRMTIGPYGVLTSESARQLAKQKLAEILSGIDPLDQKYEKN